MQGKTSGGISVDECRTEVRRLINDLIRGHQDYGKQIGQIVRQAAKSWTEDEFEAFCDDVGLPFRRMPDGRVGIVI